VTLPQRLLGLQKLGTSLLHALFEPESHWADAWRRVLAEGKPQQTGEQVAHRNDRSLRYF